MPRVLNRTGFDTGNGSPAMLTDGTAITFNPLASRSDTVPLRTLPLTVPGAVPITPLTANTTVLPFRNPGVVCRVNTCEGGLPKRSPNKLGDFSPAPDPTSAPRLRSPKLGAG